MQQFATIESNKLSKNRSGGKMGLFERILGAFKNTDIAAPPLKPGRNEDCWCGSGRKYKKCHMPEDESTAANNCRPACNT
jgi:hypothetical protein